MINYVKGESKLKENELLFLLKKVSWPIKLIFIASLIAIIGSLVGLIIPIFIGQIVDMFYKEGFNSKIVMTVISIFIVNGLLVGAGSYLMMIVGEKVILELRKIIWENTLYLKMNFFDKNESGQLMSRLTDDTKIINEFISQKLPSSLPSIITLIGSFTMLIILDWRLTLVTLLTIPIFFAIMIPIGKFIEKISKETQTEVSKFSGNLGRVLINIKLVKISNNEKIELKKTNNNLINIYNLGVRQAKIFSIIQPVYSLLVSLTITLVLGFGGIRIAAGAITSGTLVAMVFYVFQMSEPLINLSSLIADYKKSLGASIRIYEIMNEEKEDIEKGKCELNTGDLEFKNVNFGYLDDNILNNLNFKLPQNSITAFVGPSGGGKSTIFDIIARLYEIEDGEVLYNSKKISEIPIGLWRSSIGYVTQTNEIMSGTIKENILYGNKQKTSEVEIRNVLKEVGLDAFINSLEKGINTEIGERGVKLSGGQKQKIAIARNLLKKPNLFLLDEATASLDSESEAIIQEAINKTSKNSTVLVIAHRLSTVLDASQIIFIDSGTVTGMGTHRDLLKSHAKYQKFIKEQSIIR